MDIPVVKHFAGPLEIVIPAVKMPYDNVCAKVSGKKIAYELIINVNVY